MCYTRRKIEDCVVALREPDDTNFLKPNGQSRNLNIYGNISEWASNNYSTCLLFGFALINHCLALPPPPNPLVHCILDQLLVCVPSRK